MKITENQVAAACQIGKRVFTGEIKASEGTLILSTQYGLNKASASDVINDYKYLLQGKVFHRAMSASAMRYFMERILDDHGERGLSNAVKALRAHIEYRENHYKTNARSMRSVADDFEGLCQIPKTTSDIESCKTDDL